MNNFMLLGVGLTGELQAIIFSIGGNKYAFDILKTLEVLRMREVTPLPDSAPWYLGIINLRGQIVPLVDAGMLLGMEAREQLSQCKIVMASTNNGAVGFVVDDINETQKFLDQDQKVVTLTSRDASVTVLSQGHDMLLLLDPDLLLARTYQEVAI